MNKPFSPGEAAEDQTGRFLVQPNGRVRPLSPHLQVWRWHVTMLASILNRMTGGALYAGALVVAAWLSARKPMRPSPPSRPRRSGWRCGSD
jgi:hypothetical protein